MGRGSSKASGGKSSGVAIKDIENTALKTMMQDIAKRIGTGGTYTYSMSQRDGKVIEKNTSEGDAFVLTDTKGNVKTTYKKKADGTWFNTTVTGMWQDNNIEPDGMARIIAGLGGLNDRMWKYKKKG